MIRFALSARTSTDDLQDPADSLRWQMDTARRLIAPHGEIVTTYHDIDKSRSLPWERRPEASRILRDLRNPYRGWDALVIAEPQRAFSGTQFEGILLQFAHYGVGLWVPELGGPVDIDNDGHYMALSNYGTMSRAERNRTRLRVTNAMRSCTSRALARWPTPLRLPHRRRGAAHQSIQSRVRCSAAPAGTGSGDSTGCAAHL
jgi:site-specific DNA recombinase